MTGSSKWENICLLFFISSSCKKFESMQKIEYVSNELFFELPALPFQPFLAALQKGFILFQIPCIKYMWKVLSVVCKTFLGICRLTALSKKCILSFSRAFTRHLTKVTKRGAKRRCGKKMVTYSFVLHA